MAENRVLRQQLRGRHIVYTHAQRRRSALVPMKLGRRFLSLDTLVTRTTLRVALCPFNRVGNRTPRHWKSVLLDAADP
jgi:hypothetical protein